MSSDGRLRIRCRATTALCCTLAPLLAFVASPAHATAECGPVPPGGGTVECPTADYLDGVSYDAGVEDLTVVVDPGSTVESGFSLVGDSDLSAILDGVSVSSTDDFESAVSVDSGRGQLILHVADASSSGDAAAGVYTRSTGSYAALYSGNVSTSGDGSAGVEAIGDAGYQVVVADFTTTTGQDSAGVSVGTKSGDVFTMTFGVETSGDDSAGVQISSGSGDIVSQSGQHIILGQVTTHGDHSDAIDLSTVDGNITSRSQYVTTFGDESAGIHAVSGSGNIAIYNGFNTSAGSLNTYGASSDGIYAKTDGSIRIVSDAIHMHGAGSDGIDAISSGGSIFISSNSIETDAAASRGIVADAAQDLSIVSGTISTQGKYGTGITAVAHYGDISISGGDVSTDGDDAFGIIATALNGGIDISVGDVTTDGFYSRGVQALGGSDVKIVTGDVSTHSPSFAAAGITAISTQGSVAIGAGSVDVYGSHSYGIYAYAAGDVSITTDSVSTRRTEVDGYAEASGGIVALGGGELRLDVGSVDTQGFGIAAIETDYYGTSNISLHAGSVVASGDYGFGINAINHGYGDVSIDAGDVSTNGLLSRGINAAGAGTNTVHFRSVDTVGDYALGIYSRATNVIISGDQVSADGYGTVGIAAHADGGDITVDVGEVATRGIGAYGISLVAQRTHDLYDDSVHYGDINLTANQVETNDDYAGGIFLLANAGDIRLDGGTVETHGNYARGIRAFSVLSAPGQFDSFYRASNVAVSADHVETDGAFSDAVTIYSAAGSIGADFGSVVVHGDYSAGIVIDSPFLLAGSPPPVDIALNVDDVETEGESGVGILVFGGIGSVSVEASTVTGSGHNASGVVVFARNGGDIDVDVDNVSLHDPGGDYSFFSPGVYAVSSGGNVVVNAGIVTTEGEYSDGVIAASNGTVDYYGQLHVGDVTVSADNILTGGDSSIGVAATSAGGSVDLHAGSVETYGDYSIGVGGNALAVIPGYGASDHTLHRGDLTVVADDVVTHGDHSDGVSALGFSGGDTDVTVGTVETSGDDSYGLNVVSSGQANYYTGGFYSGSTTVTVDKVTTAGANSTGVRVFAFTGDVDLTVGSVDASGDNSDAVTATNGSDGSVVVNILDHAVSQQGFGVAAGAYDNVNVNIVDGARVFGGKVGVYAGAYSDGASAHILNQGEIATDGDGVAILAIGQGITIDNPGAVIGPVRLTDHDDVFDNSGAWQSFGSNRFGSGDDLVLNSGTLRIGSGVARQQTDWNGLERLDNRGLITLADGHADQIFDLNATSFVGNLASKLALDVGATPHGVVSDLVQLGAASGSTQLQLSGAGGIGRTLVVDAESSTGAGNFFLTGGAEDLGFVRMTLDYDAGRSDWTLVGSPDQEAFEGVRFGAQAQSLWRRSIDTWSRVMDEAPAPERFTLWGRYLTGHEDQHSHPTFSALGVDYSPSLNTDAHWDGALVGASFGRGGWSWGALLGVTRQTTRFTSDDNKLKTKGTNFGAFAGWTGGTSFARAVANYQHVRAKAGLTTAATDDTLHGSVVGVRGEAGLDLAAGTLRIRPLVSLTWTHGHLDDLQGPGATLDFHGFTSLEGSAGASLSGTLRAAATTFHPYAGLYAVHEFAGDNPLDLHVGSQSLRLVDKPQSDHAKATTGFAADLGGVFRLSVGGEAEFLDGRNALKGQIGLSWHG